MLFGDFHILIYQKLKTLPLLLRRRKQHLLQWHRQFRGTTLDPKIVHNIIYKIGGKFYCKINGFSRPLIQHTWSMLLSFVPPRRAEVLPRLFFEVLNHLHALASPEKINGMILYNKNILISTLTWTEHRCGKCDEQSRSNWGKIQSKLS